MSSYTQLKQISNDTTIKRKKEYIKYNFGRYIDPILKKKDCTVLEIGPGMGDFVKYCNEHGVKAIDVIDMDRDILTNIKKNDKIRKTILTDTPHKHSDELDKYNIIIATQVLEHVQKKEHVLFLQMLFTHLKKGGFIILTVPNIGNPLGIFERYYDYTHETAFTERSLMQLVDHARLGKAEVKVQPFGIPPYSTINIVRKGIQCLLHLIFKGLYMANGGVYPTVLTTNISLVIERVG